MPTYEEAKSLLLADGFSVRFFSKGFYNRFCEDYKNARNDLAAGRKPFAKTKKSAFCKMNLNSYRRFLALIRASFPLYSITFFNDSWECTFKKEMKRNFESRAAAESFAEKYRHESFRRPDKVTFTIKEVRND